MISSAACAAAITIGGNPVENTCGRACCHSNSATADVVLLVSERADAWPEAPPGRPVVRVQTKRDLGGALADGAIATSATTGLGLDDLRRAVLARAGVGDAERGDEHVVVSARQRELLTTSGTALAAAAALLAAAQPMELVAVELRAAMDALAAVTGREVSEAMLDALFARFCIGK